MAVMAPISAIEAATARLPARLSFHTGRPSARRSAVSWGPPVLAGGRVLVAGSNAQLFEVDAGNGEVSARLQLPAGCQLQPAVAQGSAYLQCDNGAVVALRGVG